VATGISEDGFLSDQALGLSKAIKREHKQLFFYLDDVNKQAHRYRGLWRIKGRDLKKLFTAALFHRALTAYQALILLTQKGFASEARATCRNILEAKFKLAFLFVEPEAPVLLIAAGEKKRADRLRNMKAGKLPVPKELKNQDWDGIIAKAEEHLVDEKGVKRKLPTMSDIAKRCGLETDYSGYYSFFSEATHAGHIELQEYLQFNAGGTAVETLLYGPADGDWVDLVALEGAGFLIDAMEISARVLGIRDKREFGLLFNAILKRYHEIVQRFKHLYIEEKVRKRTSPTSHAETP
jgi:hypothetical protein